MPLEADRRRFVDIFTFRICRSDVELKLTGEGGAGMGHGPARQHADIAWRYALEL
jgi:hypothetical protein